MFRLVPDVAGTCSPWENRMRSLCKDEWISVQSERILTTWCKEIRTDFVATLLPAPHSPWGTLGYLPCDECRSPISRLRVGSLGTSDGDSCGAERFETRPLRSQSAASFLPSRSLPLWKSSFQGPPTKTPQEQFGSS